MRIAVCLSGALRTFAACAPSIASYFGDVDYYGAFWTWDRETLAPDEPGTFLPFKAVSFEEQPKEFPRFAPGLRLKNNLARPMYLGMMKSHELLERTAGDPSGYDLVFRCRPDLLLPGKLSDVIDSMGEDKAYFPDHSQYGGCCDQFAGGPPEPMKAVFTAYQALDLYDGPPVHWNAEILLKYWLDRHGVAVGELPIEFKICRHEFVGLRYEDIPRDSNRFRRWTPNDPSAP